MPSRDIIQSYVLDLKVFVDSMQLVSNTGFQIAITMTACSRIEINAAMPVTAASLSYTTIVTALYSNHVKPLCNLQEDLN